MVSKSAKAQKPREVKFELSESLEQKLEELRSLLDAKGAQMSLTELIEYMTDTCITTAKAKKFGQKRANATTAPALENSIKLKKNNPKNNRYIPKATQYFIWQRDQGQCTICKSKRNVQVDHIKPIALGGISKPNNLRLVCFHCNQRLAMKTFGVDYMSQF